MLNELKSRYNVDVAQLPGADLSQLTSTQAASLMQKLAEYPDMLTHAANELAPHAVAFYLRDLAGEFHSFYNAERVLVDDEAPRNARAALPPRPGRCSRMVWGARRVCARQDVTQQAARTGREWLRLGPPSGARRSLFTILCR